MRENLIRIQIGIQLESNFVPCVLFKLFNFCIKWVNPCKIQGVQYKWTIRNSIIFLIIDLKLEE